MKGVVESISTILRNNYGKEEEKNQLSEQHHDRFFSKSKKKKFLLPTFRFSSLPIIKMENSSSPSLHHH